jgi:uncharacterized protein YndB with AHSA1/START domain
MVRLEATVDIDRPLQEVFAYVSDLTHVPEWVPSMPEVTVDGPARVGARVCQTHSFLGRVDVVTAEITEYEPNARLALSSRSPFRASQVITFRSRKGGTRVHGELQAELGVLAPAARLFLRKAKREQQADYARLKAVLEGRPSVP